MAILNEIEVTLDFYTRRVTKIEQTPVQNDSLEYKFIITPEFQGETLTLDPAWTYTATVRRPNATSSIDAATAVSGNIEYTLGSTFLEQYGRHYFTIEIYESGAKRLTSAAIVYEVLQEAGGDGTITEDDNYPILTDLIEAMETSNALWTEDGDEISTVEDLDLNLGANAIVMTDATLGGEYLITLDDGVLTITPKA